jgi:hypothetical protein
VSLKETPPVVLSPKSNRSKDLDLAPGRHNSNPSADIELRRKEAPFKPKLVHFWAVSARFSPVIIAFWVVSAG